MEKIQDIYLPSMGHSVREVQITKWHKQAGDKIRLDDIYIEVSTDKIENEIPAEFSGTVIKTYGEEGDKVPLNKPIMQVEIF
jgi:pyruvate/2-oxoglutarate dehydrogenase complex dihydrolipoamide acyltransferase (E2) component